MRRHAGRSGVISRGAAKEIHPSHQSWWQVAAASRSDEMNESGRRTQHPPFLLLRVRISFYVWNSSRLSRACCPALLSNNLRNILQAHNNVMPPILNRRNRLLLFPSGIKQKLSSGPTTTTTDREIVSLRVLVSFRPCHSLPSPT